MERKFDYIGKTQPRSSFKNSYKLPCDLLKTANVYSNSLNFRRTNPARKIRKSNTFAAGNILSPQIQSTRMNIAQINLNEKQQIIRQEFIDGNDEFANKIDISLSNRDAKTLNSLPNVEGDAGWP